MRGNLNSLTSTLLTFVINSIILFCHFASFFSYGAWANDTDKHQTHRNTGCNLHVKKYNILPFHHNSKNNRFFFQCTASEEEETAVFVCEREQAHQTDTESYCLLLLVSLCLPEGYQHRVKRKRGRHAPAHSVKWRKRFESMLWHLFCAPIRAGWLVSVPQKESKKNKTKKHNYLWAQRIREERDERNREEMKRENEWKRRGVRRDWRREEGWEKRQEAREQTGREGKRWESRGEEMRRESELLHKVSAWWLPPRPPFKKNKNSTSAGVCG